MFSVTVQLQSNNQVVMNWNFWITALIAFINSLSFTVLIPIIYLYGKQFGLSDFETSLLFSIYSIAQFFATPVIGKLSDRFGRKPLLIISLARTAIANLIAGTATTAVILFLARLLDGITGGNASVAQAIISDVTMQKNRACNARPRDLSARNLFTTDFKLLKYTILPLSAFKSVLLVNAAYYSGFGC
ncbi:MAG: MFS transporter [Nostoc sp. ChiSLP01]|nr:MFS transporter [Nostoc sp. CmiSLP01]MDZ8288333.1 MFS transporter [Nostoc sp. ChiSLP01]